jgi:hypothetical protein
MKRKGLPGKGGPKRSADNRSNQPPIYTRPAPLSSPSNFARDIAREEFSDSRRAANWSGGARLRWQPIALRNARRENGGRS